MAASRFLTVAVAVVLAVSCVQGDVSAETAADLGTLPSQGGFEIPHIVHQTWGDFDALPPQLAGYGETWHTLNPSWEIKQWDDEAALKMIDANYPRFSSTYRSLSTGSEKADLFRYLVVHKYGGVYADVDTECMLPLDAVLPPGKSLVVGYEGNPEVTSKLMPNGFVRPRQVLQWTFAAAAGHPALFDAAERLAACAVTPSPCKEWKDPVHTVLERTGPGVFSDAVLSGEFDHKWGPPAVLPHTVFGIVPKHYISKGKNIPDDAAVVHHFIGSWRYQTPQKTPAGSENLVTKGFSLVQNLLNNNQNVHVRERRSLTHDEDMMYDTMSPYGSARVSGVLSQTYIAGASVFADTNNNMMWDDGEAGTYTNYDGTYDLYFPEDYPEFQIVTMGGTRTAFKDEESPYYSRKLLEHDESPYMSFEPLESGIAGQSKAFAMAAPYSMDMRRKLLQEGEEAAVGNVSPVSSLLYHMPELEEPLAAMGGTNVDIANPDGVQANLLRMVFMIESSIDAFYLGDYPLSDEPLAAHSIMLAIAGKLHESKGDTSREGLTEVSKATVWAVLVDGNITVHGNFTEGVIKAAAMELGMSLEEILYSVDEIIPPGDHLVTEESVRGPIDEKVAEVMNAYHDRWDPFLMTGYLSDLPDDVDWKSTGSKDQSDIDPTPVADDTPKIETSMELSGLKDFTAEDEVAFVAGFAEALGVTAEDVEIEEIVFAVETEMELKGMTADDFNDDVKATITDSIAEENGVDASLVTVELAEARKRRRALLQDDSVKLDVTLPADDAASAKEKMESLNDSISDGSFADALVSALEESGVDVSGLVVEAEEPEMGVQISIAAKATEGKTAEELAATLKEAKESGALTTALADAGMDMTGVELELGEVVVTGTVEEEEDDDDSSKASMGLIVGLPVALGGVVILGGALTMYKRSKGGASRQDMSEV